MTQNEFKIGDVVHLKDQPQIDKEFNLPPSPVCLYRVDDIQDGKLTLSLDCSDVRFIVDAEHFELAESPDRRTAFLTELQALLRKYDARIYDGELYAIHIEIGYHGAKSEQADYLFYQSDNDEINADNIMDFDKEWV